MLTRDLLRFRVDGDRVEPRWVRPTPAVRDLAQELLALHAGMVGGVRAELDESVLQVVHRSRSQVLARGLVKLIQDACGFSDPADGAAEREAILDASAALLAGAPAANAEAHRASVLQARRSAGLPAELYGDLPHRARLETTPDWAPDELLDRTNMAQAQGLLLGASGMTVTVGDRDAGQRRRLIKALRFHRLLADLHGNENQLRLTITGPGSVLDQATRYGLQLAQFLPHLATCSDWRAEAQLALPKRGGAATLVLDQHSPLAGGSRYLAFTPEGLRDLPQRLRNALAGWHIDPDPPLLVMPGGELVAPDLGFQGASGSWVMECFHRWHQAPVLRRLHHLSQGLAPRLLVAVDRALSRSPAVAEALDAPALRGRWMAFNDLPAPRSVKQMLQALTER